MTSRGLATASHARQQSGGLNASRRAGRVDDDESEEDEGRGALFGSARGGSKKNLRKTPVAVGDEVMTALNGEEAAVDDGGDVAGELTVPTANAQSASKPAKRKATSYLDEILAEKGAKRKKKKKKADA